jgi:hypothetical protein
MKILFGLGAEVDAIALAHELITAIPSRLDQLLQRNPMLTQDDPDLIKRPAAATSCGVVSTPPATTQ